MKTLITIVIIILILGGVFLYFTRPPSAPSTDVDNVTSTTTDSSLTMGTSYKISQAGSMVSFKIGEVLNSKPNTVIGTTSEVGGEILVSSTTISFGEIAVNARTFKTDSEKRDGVIARAILKSEDAANEFITFRPSAPIQNQNINMASSTTVTFDLMGDLTIAGVTKPATMKIVMTVAPDKLTGTATLAMKRSDFSLTIPSVPQVASVDQDMTVTSTIVALIVK